MVGLRPLHQMMMHMYGFFFFFYRGASFAFCFGSAYQGESSYFASYMDEFHDLYSVCVFTLVGRSYSGSPCLSLCSYSLLRAMRL